MLTLPWFTVMAGAEAVVPGPATTSGVQVALPLTAQ